MYRNFNLTDEERKQILEHHKSHGYRKPLNEDDKVTGDTENKISKQSNQNQLGSMNSIDDLVGKTANVVDDYGRNKGVLTILSVEPDKKYASELRSYEKKTLFGKKTKSELTPAANLFVFNVDLNGQKGTLTYQCGTNIFNYHYMRSENSGVSYTLYSKQLIDAIEKIKCSTIRPGGFLSKKMSVPKTDFVYEDKSINEDMGLVDFDEYGIEQLTKAGFKKISNGKFVKGKYKVVIYTKGCSEKYPGFTLFKDDKPIYQACPDDCWVWWKDNKDKLK